ncbi:hypothetical protein GIB67_040691, partial [Kingdonia uniflora]
MNDKVPPTASNRRKRELAREEDLVTYKRKRKTIDPTTVVPPNTAETANEGGSKFDTESAQATLGAQPPLPNVPPDSDVNIPIVGEYSESEGATSNEDIGPSDRSLLRSFRFHRARSIALGQEKLSLCVHHHQPTWDLTKEPQAGFSTLVEVFENNLLQGLKALKALKARGAKNSLSLKKLREYYAYKLGKVLSDGTATVAKKKKGLTAKSVARAYMLYVCGSFLFLTKKATDVSARYIDLFTKDKVAKKWSRGSTVLAHMYYNLGAASQDDGRLFGTHTEIKGIPHMRSRSSQRSRKFNPKYEWVDCFSGQKWKDFVLKKADRGRRVREGPLVCTEGYLEWFASVSWTTICPIAIDLAADDDAGVHQRKEATVNEHGDTPVRHSQDVAEQYDASHHEHSSRSLNINLNDQQITTLNDQLKKLKEDKNKESEANINLRETLKEK